ncbi:MAG: tetratricopeptide repeat protein [Defluviitaleaceae bacterium]|nr:tetratricopeptide repeat protein [Defluviitaleaceae bacterium]
MRCPNCGKDFQTGKRCPHCRIDSVLFTSTERISDRLFNKGLERLHLQDMTGGVHELGRAVSVNKHNIRARNLLGLALFEMGRIGDALKHWLISRSQLKENNNANLYLEALRKDTRNFERLNDAVVLYNRALEFIAQGHNDLAAIQLRKSLEHNPRFVDALNLLALCHMQQRNTPQANATLERVFAVDARNPVALRYFNALNPRRPRAEAPPRSPSRPILPPTETSPYWKIAETSAQKSINISNKKPTYFHAVGILSFIIGAAVMLACVYFLYLPAIRREHAQALREEQRATETAAQAAQDQMDERDEADEERQIYISNLHDQIADLEMRYNRANDTIIVHLAVNRFNNGNGSIEDFREAVRLLDLITLEALHFDTIATAQHIRAVAFPALATHYATTGVTAFNDGDYARALVLLEDSLLFITPDNPQYAHVLYHLGTLYYRAPNRNEDTIHLLTRLTSLEEYETLPATPWNLRRGRVTTMLSNLGIN